MDEVWSLLERLFEKVFDKPLNYDKYEPHCLRKYFEEMKKRDLNQFHRKKEGFEWLPLIQ